MTAHNISFLYTGRMTDAGAMDAGYFERAMAGARIVLASHCHFATSGRIPARVTVKTRDFRVVAAAPRYGSVDMLFLVVFTGAGLLAFKFLEGLASGIGEGMGRDFYKIVLSRTVRASFQRCADRRKLSYEEPDAAMRKEPHRSWPNADQLRPQKDARERREGNAPTGNIANQYEKLSNMTDRSMVRIANPIGREGGSRGLEVRIDGESIGHLYERQPPRTDVRPQDDVYRRIVDEISRMG